jgi:hypothetical protein
MADPVAIADAAVRTKALKDAALVVKKHCGALRNRQRKEWTGERQRFHTLLMRLAKQIEDLDATP